MVQQVVLILHSDRVNGLFLSSCYCLYLVLPVLPMPTYISGCWNGSHLHLSQTKPQIGDRSCSIPCSGSHCWGSASYPTANLLTRNLQNIYYIHIGLSSVVYTHEHWKVLYHLVLYIWIYILFEQLSHSKQFCSHPSGFSHNFVLILSKLITLWQLRGKKRGGGGGVGARGYVLRKHWRASDSPISYATFQSTQDQQKPFCDSADSHSTCVMFPHSVHNRLQAQMFHHISYLDRQIDK